MFPGRWMPAAVGIMDEPFTEENRMLNSTMKMVRNRVVEHYKDLIDFLYTPSGKDILNERNMATIRKLMSGK